MDKSQIEATIRVLEHVRKRPGMCFGDIREENGSHLVEQTVNSVSNFIGGLNIAFAVLGMYQNRVFGQSKYHMQVRRDRGWEASGSGPVWYEMRKRGLSDSEIIEELLTIEIEALKRHPALDEDVDTDKDFQISAE